jgi:ABC-2 type transport system ATP-binding protein
MAPVVSFQEVVKDFPRGWLGRERLRALAGVSLDLQPGEIVALVGPNRAGKTTLVKILLSLCRPTSGKVERLGKPARDRTTLRRVGYVHENQAFPRYLTARSFLEYLGALSLLQESVVKNRVTELLKRVGLADRANEPISRFSKGMVQRLGLAQALLNSPDLLILDEPSEGLDLAGRLLVREILTELRQQGKTVLYVSHLLSEIEKVCDRVAVLVAGKLVQVSATAELAGKVPRGQSPSLELALRKYFQIEKGQ